MEGKAKGGRLSCRRLMADLFDGVDEERAVRLRLGFGQKRWILSWQPRDDGTWLARLSLSGPARTVERNGRTRVEAIERAARTLRQAIELKLKRAQAN